MVLTTVELGVDRIAHAKPRIVSEPYVSTVTACAIATSCCISDVPSQWEGRNFDPPQLPHFQPILMKLETKKYIRDTTLYAKFGQCWMTGRGSA